MIYPHQNWTIDELLVEVLNLEILAMASNVDVDKYNFYNQLDVLKIEIIRRERRDKKYYLNKPTRREKCLI